MKVWLVMSAVVLSVTVSGCDTSSSDASGADGRAAAAAQWRPEDHRDDIAGAAAALDREAQRRWPDEYAGSWIDGGVIWLAFTSSPQPKVAELRRDVRQPHRVRGVERKSTLGDVVALQQRIVDDRSALRAGAPPDGMPAAIVETEGSYDVDIDVPHGVVIVSLEDARPPVKDAFRDYYGSNALVFEEGVAVPGG